MRSCAEHRPFLAAIADGETPVPAETLDHVRDCPECAHEVELQRAVGNRLRQALEAPVRKRAPGVTRRRAAGLATAVVVAALAVVAGAFALNLSRPDPVLAAAHASQQPAQFASSDPSQIGAWCVRESGRPMPEMELPPLRAMGARMDRQAGAEIVTVYYRSPDDQPVTVSWLDATPTSDHAVSSRMVGGHLVLVARSPHGTAVISGEAPDSLLWSTAAVVEDGS